MELKSLLQVFHFFTKLHDKVDGLVDKMNRACCNEIIEEQATLDICETNLKDLNVTQMKLVDDSFPKGDTQILNQKFV